MNNIRPIPLCKLRPNRGLYLTDAAKYLGLHPYVLEAAAQTGLISYRYGDGTRMVFDVMVLDRWRSSKEYKTLTR